MPTLMEAAPDVVILCLDAPFYAEALEPVRDRVTVLATEDVEEAAAAGGTARALIAMPFLVDRSLIERMPRLEWFQTLTSGTDMLSRLELPRRVRVTSAKGVHGPQMAELVLFQMLCFTRNARAILERQRERRWDPTPQRLLLDRRALIIGVGGIAEHIATRCAAFGMDVVGVSRARTSAPGFRKIIPFDRLQEAVGGRDFVIVVAPYGPETHHMVDAALLRSMDPGTMLVNVARGSLVDEAALIAALQDGTIAGAALDVFESEPLPENSPLWHMANVLITPHVGGFSDIYHRQIAPLLLANIDAWLRGEKLLNEVPG